jgi:hypothetical protein
VSKVDDYDYEDDDANDDDDDDDGGGGDDYDDDDERITMKQHVYKKTEYVHLVLS